MTANGREDVAGLASTTSVHTVSPCVRVLVARRGRRPRSGSPVTHGSL